MHDAFALLNASFLSCMHEPSPLLDTHFFTIRIGTSRLPEKQACLVQVVEEGNVLPDSVLPRCASRIIADFCRAKLSWSARVPRCNGI